MLHSHEKAAPSTNYAKVSRIECYDLVLSIAALMMGIHGCDFTKEE